ncbi:MAG: phosphatase PAP2 family protein [Nocardioidaceae bacterium]|nr:phosphatase PAP2 family protein [Nocardioidaceae bacterium]
MSHRGEEEPTGTDSIGTRDLAQWPSRLGSNVARWVVSITDRVARSDDDARLPYVVLAVVAGIGLLAAALMTALSAQVYEDVAQKDGSATLDQPVLDQMIEWRSPARNDLVTQFTDVGSSTVMPFIATAAAVLLALWWRKWTPVLLMAVVAGGSVVMTVVGKQLVGRVRPAHELGVPPYESSPAFPSGHSLNSWVIFLMIAYLAACRLNSRPGRIAFVAAAVTFATAMGLSRVYLGHHWLTDVLVAWALGSTWLILVITGHRLALTVQRHVAAPGPTRRE